MSFTFFYDRRAFAHCGAFAVFVCGREAVLEALLVRLLIALIDSAQRSSIGCTDGPWREISGTKHVLEKNILSCFDLSRTRAKSSDSTLRIDWIQLFLTALARFSSVRGY